MDNRETFLPIADSAADALGVPRNWVRGVIGAESSYQDVGRTWEVNAGQYSYGPMQVLGTTARGDGYTGPLDGLLDPRVGIWQGTVHLQKLLQRYGNDFPNVISAYNRGSADPVAGAAYVRRVEGWISELGESDFSPWLLVGAGLLLVWYAERQPRKRRF